MKSWLRWDANSVRTRLLASSMVGGIVINNASGMSCGTHANSDKTLLSARIVFLDGTILDTGDPASKDSFRRSHPAFLRTLETLRDEITADPALSERIRRKYAIKNVTGLNILPFIRFTDPFEILAHLLVGSEGTLAFLSEVTMKTLPLAPYKASAMIYFRSIRAAAEAVVALKKDIGLEIIHARNCWTNGPCSRGRPDAGGLFRSGSHSPSHRDHSRFFLGTAGSHPFHFEYLGRL